MKVLLLLISSLLLIGCGFLDPSTAEAGGGFLEGLGDIGRSIGGPIGLVGTGLGLLGTIWQKASRAKESKTNEEKLGHVVDVFHALERAKESLSKEQLNLLHDKLSEHMSEAAKKLVRKAKTVGIL